VADVRNGAHHEPAAEGRDTLVDSTDPDPLDLSRDQVHMQGETVMVTRKMDPERGKSTVNGENRMLVEVVDPEPLTGDHPSFPKGDRDLGPNSKTRSLCSCLFNMEHPLDGLHPEIPMSSVMD
jgi:hypothetical protein